MTQEATPNEAPNAVPNAVKAKKPKTMSLTEEQKAMFPVWVEKYTALGLSTAPADKPRAERGIIGHYNVANIPTPSVFVWVSSPMVLSLAAPMAAYLIENRRPVKEADMLDLIATTLVNVAENFRNDICKAVIATGAAGADDLPAPDKATLVPLLRKAIQENWSRHNGGASWISFVAWATFVRDVLGHDIPIGPREDTDSSCGWWWPHTDFVMISDRPAEIHRDTQGRLHHPSRPAISWRDGWCLYFWRGTRVPASWITSPETLDPKIGLTHENIELRRCAAEIVGWGRVIETLNPKIVDEDPDPTIGTLMEVVIEGVPEKFLKVQCGTGRTFVIPVAPSSTTALEANASTFQIDASILSMIEART